MMNLLTGNPDAGCITINKGEVYVDGRIVDRSVCIDDDLVHALSEISARIRNVQGWSISGICRSKCQ